MTSWTRNSDIKKRLEKKWNKGEFLARSVSPDPFEPLHIPLKRPNARELANEFEAARAWVAHLVHHAGTERKKGYAIEWQEVNHRTLGKNKIPQRVVFRTLEEIFDYLAKTAEADRYEKRFKEITTRFPELEELLKEKPHEVLAHDPDWETLLAIVDHIRAHPRPGIYLRQLEIPGVDTKFIETRKAWLTRLLTCLLPPEAVDTDAKGPSAFEHRFGFRAKPARIRFRTLDPDLSPMGLSDLEMPAADFNDLPVKPATVFVVENEITGLSFPFFPKGMVIIGLGYGLSALSGALWMHDRPVWYWGDLDTHGFAMLDQIRHHFPRTRSFLMDEATLLSHKALWGEEPSPTGRDLALLTSDEAGVYDALRHNLHGRHLRLEQERISFSLVRQMVEEIQKDRAHPPLLSQGKFKAK